MKLRGGSYFQQPACHYIYNNKVYYLDEFEFFRSILKAKKV